MENKKGWLLFFLFSIFFLIAQNTESVNQTELEKLNTQLIKLKLDDSDITMQKQKYGNATLGVKLVWDTCNAANPWTWYTNPTITYPPDGYRDSDWFKISGLNDGGYYVLLETLRSGDDFDLYLYASCSGGYFDSSANWGTSNDYLSFSGHSGTVYIRVYAYAWSGRGNYRLTVIPTLGNPDYCDFWAGNGAPCTRGGYDCDSNSECSSGLECKGPWWGDGAGQLDGCCYSSDEWDTSNYQCISCDCSSGPCCSDGCNYNPSDSQPSGYTDSYYCDGSNSVTGTNYVKKVDYYCSGSSSAAQSRTLTQDTCEVCEYCSGGQSSCSFYSSSNVCDSNYGGYFYSCDAGTGAGSDVYRYTKKRYCSGSSSGCSGAIVDNTHSVYANCGSTQFCRQNGDTSCTTFPTITSSYVNPTEIRPGDRFSAYYTINNPNSYSLQAVLGLSIYTPSGQEVYDTTHDDEVTLVSGSMQYSRLFDTQSNNPTGLYDVVWGLWHQGMDYGFGTRSINDYLTLSTNICRDYNRDGSINSQDVIESIKIYFGLPGALTGYTVNKGEVLACIIG